MRAKIGERVGAIIGERDGKVEYLGPGTYVGDKVPHDAVGWMAETLIENESPNPAIELDSGGVVYGCECWWGPEDKVLTAIGSQEVKDVTIDEIRERFRQEAKKGEGVGQP